MKLLILGGTRFLGRHIAEQALQRGHAVTLLHRGRSGPALFPHAEHRIADRDGDLSTLAAGHWDAAIDTSAYFPRQVQAMAAALGPRVDHYQLVSSISAYASLATAGTTEDAPLATLADPTVEAVTGETYGGLKALCEQAAQAAFGGRCLINRPGLIVGPHDPTGRFTWWVTRLVRGGNVLAPGDPAAPVQFIDARDAAAWMLLQAEQARGGVFNLTGPNAPLTMGGFLDTARRTLNAGAHLQWVDKRHRPADVAAAGAGSTAPGGYHAGAQHWTGLSAAGAHAARHGFMGGHGRARSSATGRSGTPRCRARARARSSAAGGLGDPVRRLIRQPFIGKSRASARTCCASSQGRGGAKLHCLQCTHQQA